MGSLLGKMTSFNLHEVCRLLKLMTNVMKRAGKPVNVGAYLWPFLLALFRRKTDDGHEKKKDRRRRKDIFYA